MSNSVDPDETAHLDLRCLHRSHLDLRCLHRSHLDLRCLHRLPVAMKELRRMCSTNVQIPLSSLIRAFIVRRCF